LPTDCRSLVDGWSVVDGAPGKLWFRPRGPSDKEDWRALAKSPGAIPDRALASGTRDCPQRCGQSQDSSLAHSAPPGERGTSAVIAAIEYVVQRNLVLYGVPYTEVCRTGRWPHSVLYTLRTVLDNGQSIFSHATVQYRTGQALLQRPPSVYTTASHEPFQSPTHLPSTDDPIWFPSPHFLHPITAPGRPSSTFQTPVVLFTDLAVGKSCEESTCRNVTCAE
jgi:hypothetical protein